MKNLTIKDFDMLSILQGFNKKFIVPLSILFFSYQSFSQCPTGYSQASSANSLLVNGTFANQGGALLAGIPGAPATTNGINHPSISFYSQAGRTVNGAYANQSGGGFTNAFALQTGNIPPGSWFGIDNANQFPGDPVSLKKLFILNKIYFN